MENFDANVLSLSIEQQAIQVDIHGNLNKADKIVLFCHGFPGTDRLSRLKNMVDVETLAIAEMNYRGDRNCEGFFSFLGSMADIHAVALHLKKTYHKPIRAFGLSMGGFYCANLAFRYPELFSDVVLLNAVVNPADLFGNHLLMKELWEVASQMLTLRTQQEYTKEIAEILSAYNPMQFAGVIRCPVRVVQASGDDITPPEFAREFYDKLSCHKTYHEIPNAGHGLQGDEEVLIASIA